MVTTVQTSTLLGVDAVPVAVEVKIGTGKKEFHIIGLGDNAIKESRDRVCTALAHSGFTVPDKILVNLAPADLKKEGASFDLAIAVAVLAASGHLQDKVIRDPVWFGELSLNGQLKPVRGIAACVAEARRLARPEVFVPAANYAEATLIEGIAVHGFRSLLELIGYLKGGPSPELPTAVAAPDREAGPARFITDVIGQTAAKRAITIAAAGGHNLLLIGPPGCGKSMLAERFPALLPPLTQMETLECVKIHSAAGHPIEGILCGERPFRHPHYIISDAGLVGGGNPPRPGEITLAHNGVLFLDELPEFRRAAIEALRIPLERGSITIARARHSITVPARFQLIAAMNPCPCGKLGTESKAGDGCKCPRATVGWYLRKLSQPILDRIDLHVEMLAVPVSALARSCVQTDPFDQEELTLKIAAAHKNQRKRNSGILNAAASQELLKEVAAIHPEGIKLLEKAAEKLGLTARGYTRMLRVARTIADLEDAAQVAPVHIAEAVSFRGLERLRKYADSEI